MAEGNILALAECCSVLLQPWPSNGPDYSKLGQSLLVLFVDKTNHSLYGEVLSSIRDEVIGYPDAFHSFT